MSRKNTIVNKYKVHTADPSGHKCFIIGHPTLRVCLTPDGVDFISRSFPSESSYKCKRPNDYSKFIVIEVVQKAVQK